MLFQKGEHIVFRRDGRGQSPVVVRKTQEFLEQMGFVQQILPRGQHRLNSSVGQQIHRLPSAPVAQQKEAENRQLLARHTAQKYALHQSGRVGRDLPWNGIVDARSLFLVCCDIFLAEQRRLGRFFGLDIHRKLMGIYAFVHAAQKPFKAAVVQVDHI